MARDYADRYPPADRADLLEECAIEAYTVGSAHESVVAQLDAVGLRRQLGDPQRLGASLRWLSRFQWFDGRRADAEVSAREASAVLVDAGDQSLYALALSNEAQLALLAHDTARTLELSARAIAIARETGDCRRAVPRAEQLRHGTHVPRRARGHGRARRGRARSLSRSTTSRMRPAPRSTSSGACSTSTGSTWPSSTSIALSRSPNVPSSSASSRTSRWSRRGSTSPGPGGTTRSRWSIRCPIPPHARCVALTVIGTVRLRRGDDGVDEALDEAKRLADQFGELQRRGPVAVARAEAALMRGDAAAARAIARPEYDEAVHRGRPVVARGARRPAAARGRRRLRGARTGRVPGRRAGARGLAARRRALARSRGAVPRGRRARREPRRGRPARGARHPRPHRRAPARTPDPGASCASVVPAASRAVRRPRRVRIPRVSPSARWTCCGSWPKD